jgi:hypothetical protein
MHFKNVLTIKHPQAIVWATIRDHLPDIVARQEDIEYVKVIKKEKRPPHALRVVSQWKANPPLPQFLKKFIKPDMMIWTDDAIWDDDAGVCSFTIKAHYDVEDINSVGMIEFKPMAGGKSTRITYSGSLTIQRTSRSSVFMTGFIIRGIESVASRLISHNFAKTVKVLTAHIEDRK